MAKAVKLSKLVQKQILLRNRFCFCYEVCTYIFAEIWRHYGNGRLAYLNVHPVENKQIPS
jgi:hypothetical protein